MIKILSADQIRELDANTIREEPVQSIDLMERACRAFVTWFITYVDISKKTGIVCGTGNNGGDGLGIARMLKDRGYAVKVWVVRGPVPESEDFKVNLQRLDSTVVVELKDIVDVSVFSGQEVLIDALFGSGISRTVEGIYKDVIKAFNDVEALKVAVDLPSGLMADRNSTGEIVKADHTVSFQLPKLAFFLPQSYPYTGEWTLVDIGLRKNFIREAETSYYYVRHKDACRILRPRTRFAHKGTFGHAKIIAGSYGKAGAAVLATRAALRTGAGLVTAHIPAGCYNVLQTAVPEAMVETDLDEMIVSDPGDLSKYTTLGVGPGLGQDPRTVKAMGSVLANFRKPIVIDADGLNIISEHRALLDLIPEGSILTPHPKEFERLSGKWANDFERLEKQRQLASQFKCIIILKGAYTSIATPASDVYFNSTGNPGMATGGTGDVLTGILTGLLAQSYSAEEAAILGVYLHGLAADVVAAERGMRGIIASDLIEFLPFAFKKLNRA